MLHEAKGLLCWLERLQDAAVINRCLDIRNYSVSSEIRHNIVYLLNYLSPKTVDFVNLNNIILIKRAWLAVQSPFLRMDAFRNYLLLFIIILFYSTFLFSI